MRKEIKSQSVEELQKIKKIINIIISLLENNISSMREGGVDLNEQQKELLHFLIGNKENVVSIITKLSNLLLKFGILEEKYADNSHDIEDIDAEIIRKYLDEQSKNK
ncbi:MAG: hypothetical protein LBS34_02280 [Rickettsiales bacterium]|jgi:hypothetical protein|nr:hypothetical protein [Rickettsiales bacterium]